MLKVLCKLLQVVVTTGREREALQGSASDLSSRGFEHLRTSRLQPAEQMPLEADEVLRLLQGFLHIS